MILFYNKDSGKIFATIEGRVHDQKAMECSVDDGTKNIGKYIIGWEETNETEEKEIEQEELVEVDKNLFTKIKKKAKIQVGKKVEHNMKDFKILQAIEDGKYTDYIIKQTKYGRTITRDL